VAVASAGPYANHLHLAPDREPRQHLITQFLTAWMLFLTSNQLWHSNEGMFQSFTEATVNARLPVTLLVSFVRCSKAADAVSKAHQQESGVYPYLPMVQLSHDQFWGSTF